MVPDNRTPYCFR